MKKTWLLTLFTIFVALVGTVAQATGPLKTTDYSSTITTGGTFQTITTTEETRRSVDFQNICSVSGNCTSTSNVCYLYFGSGTPTTANSLVIPAGNGYLRSNGVIPNDTIKLTCTGTGDKFYLKIQ